MPPRVTRMFALHASVVNGYLDRRLENVSRKLELAQQRSGRLRQIDSTPSYLVFSQPSEWMSRTQGLMYQTLCLRPSHLPILLCLSLLLIASTEARVPRKPHVVGEKPKLMRHGVPHTQAVDEKDGSSPRTAHPLVAHDKSHLPEDMIDLSTRIYSAMGKQNTTLVVNEFKPQFDDLNNRSEGELGKTLGAAFEVRLLDLQQSVRHAKAMLEVINELSDAATGCVLCDP